jgi:dolichyl-phosphate beta-glucosyltransferase
MKNTLSPKFSIIIPSYNEENRIKSTLLLVDDYLISNNIDAEIIVVSDGSSDKTEFIVDELRKKIRNLQLIRYSKNNGKGYAVKIGVENSRGEYILFLDADNSTPIEELDVLYKKLIETKSQIAIGSRYLSKSNVKIKQPKYRIALGRLGNMLVRFFLIPGIKDTQCGFKMFTQKSAQDIFSQQKIKRFGFDIEALVIAKHLGYKIVEVPVSWFNSAESRVRPVRDALRTLRDLIYIKLNLWRGLYKGNNLPK